MQRKIEDGYEVIPRLPQEVRGYRCGECGQTFEYGKAYGFVCGNMRCPIQLKVMSTQ